MNICSTETIPTDWNALLDFHLKASKSRNRPLWLRHWHAGQANAIGRHEMTWNWAIACYRASQRVAQPYLT